MPKLPPIYRNPLIAARTKREPKTRGASGDIQRPNSHQRGYDRTWARLRKMHLAEHPWCVRCEGLGVVKAAIIVDHVTTIEDAPERRLDPSNLQSLCKLHHDGWKQRLDNQVRRQARRIAGDPS